MNRYCSVLLTVLLTIFAAIPQERAYALGSGALGNETGTSARAAGFGFAFAGVADDPSAVHYNPAGLTQVKGWQTELGATILHLNSEHTTPDGQEDKMDNGWPIVPTFYLSHSGESSPWAFGLGLTSPYGLMTKWKEDSFSKYWATESQLLMYQVNPTVSYAVNDKFSLGLGVDYLNIYDVKLERKVFDPFGGADGDAKLSGDGDGWGYNVGLHWKPVEKHSFGLAYRSQVNIPVDGEAEYSNLPAAYTVGSTYKTNLHSEFKIPQSVLFGYGFKPSEKWSIMADYQWTNWAAYQETHVDYSQFISESLTPSKIDRKWKNTNSIGAGAEYKANERWDLRFGGLIYERVIPSGTLESSLPESSRWMLSAGTGYHIANTRIDFAFGTVFFNKRNIDNDKEANSTVAPNPQVYSQDGTYKTVAPFFSLGVKQKWGGPK